MIKPFLLLSSILALTSISFTSQAQNPTKLYETRICNDCSYSEAKVIAAKLKPHLQCRSVGFGPEDQECYSSTNKVLVFNAATRVGHGFYVGNDNQGQPPIYMSLFVRDIESLPEEVEILANDVVDTYQELGDIASQLTDDFNINKMSRIAGGYSARATSSACTNSPEMNVINAIKGGSTSTSSVSGRAQSIYNRNEGFRDSFVDRRLTSFNFNFAVSGFGLGGSWDYKQATNNVVNDHTVNIAGVPGATNRVVYSLQVVNGYISASFNEYGTRIAGRTLHDLKTYGTQSSDVSKCLGEALDSELDNQVTGPSGTPLGSIGFSGSLASPNWGSVNVRINRGGTGGGAGGGGSTCDVHYYYPGSYDIFATISVSC